MTRALAFPGAGSPGASRSDDASWSSDYGSWFSRLRWKRAAAADRVADWNPEDPAQAVLSQAESWVIVRDPRSVPGPASRIPEPPYARVLLAEDAVPRPPAFVHTLRELESAALEPRTEPSDADPAAVAFWTADFPCASAESLGSFLARLLRQPAGSQARDGGFLAVRFDEPSSRERPELTRRIPPGAVRILDVGCGAGGGIAGARARDPRLLWHVTGIEIDASLAAPARAHCDRFLEGDLREVLPRLAREGERYDVVVLADVLEHLEDPCAALRAALSVAAPGATLLVSVPNVGHLSLVRDLLCGRFDPLPAGLSDSGHLRWFTRAFLEELLVEAGWEAPSIESQPGAPAPDPGAILGLAPAWPGWDAESLATYQWIAEARAR